ncbi:MAG TPA: hypothetical protein DHV46_09635 [Desulfovibrio piger]|uniref:Uncharacterized protein n=1 Tax=Nitratidesulfovibrio vulgaris (strain ATCC 29579 / DSM 644 / CCUG 34227 / NCIMB 8303 / VKM B-1760 / Hildenborough) TaxID=882 RepID=Q72F30_NITV2|nr:hypothetical protein DVU_0385 [Nitratidesulfovibrio vulgaris str. Hildenborough]HCZ44772.1 hypothetical protein [Desulfovibrio piger]
MPEWCGPFKFGKLRLHKQEAYGDKLPKLIYSNLARWGAFW